MIALTIINAIMARWRLMLIGAASLVLVGCGWWLRGTLEARHELARQKQQATEQAQIQSEIFRAQLKTSEAQINHEKNKQITAIASRGAGDELLRLRNKITMLNQKRSATQTAADQASVRARDALEKCSIEYQRLAGQLDERESELREQVDRGAAVVGE